MSRAVDGALQSAVDELNRRVQADPDIQAILQQNKTRLQQTRDRGGDARKFQHQVRDQITEIARRKGYIPREANYFVNPNDGQLEPHRGWSGLNGLQRALIIGAAATGAVLTGGAALGAFGGAGAGAGGSGAAAAGAGGAGAAGAGAGGVLASSTIPAAMTSIGGPAAITGGIGAGAAGAAGATGAAAAGGAGTGFWNRLTNSASDLGRVVGDAAQGYGDQRLQEAYTNNQRDRNVLDRARLGLEAPDIRARQAARGDLQANVQDTKIDFRPTSGALPQFNVTGGMRPSALGPNARQAGAELSRQALMALMNKSDVPDIGNPTRAGALENVLGGVGLGASVVGATRPVLDVLRRRGGR